MAYSAERCTGRARASGVCRLTRRGWRDPLSRASGDMVWPGSRVVRTARKTKNVEQSQFRVTSGPAIGYTLCQARIQGELRGDGAAIRQNSTVVSKSVEKCRVLPGVGGSVRSERSAGYRFPIQRDSELLPGRSRGADRPLGATNRVSCRNVGCEAAAADGGERRNVMKSDQLDGGGSGGHCAGDLSQAALLDLEFPHPELLYLAGDGDRKGVDKPDQFRDFEIGDAAAAVIADLLGRSLLIRFQPDPSADDLAKAWIRNPDHLRLGHLGMGVQELFNLPWIDVLTPAQDHVLGAAGDAKGAVLAHDGQVAAAQPAVGTDHALGRRDVTIVARHGEITPRTQLALLADGHDLPA